MKGGQWPAVIEYFVIAISLINILASWIGLRFQACITYLNIISVNQQVFTLGNGCIFALYYNIILSVVIIILMLALLYAEKFRIVKK